MLGISVTFKKNSVILEREYKHTKVDIKLQKQILTEYPKYCIINM